VRDALMCPDRRAISRRSLQLRVYRLNLILARKITADRESSHDDELARAIKRRRVPLKIAFHLNLNEIFN
jgi:hypothetical protein